LSWLILVTLFIPVVYAQDAAFLKQLEQSRYLKQVMKVDPTDAGIDQMDTKEGGTIEEFAAGRGF